MTVYSADGMANAMGVSYRQLDYWTTKGFITSSPVNGTTPKANPGIGRMRIWTGREATTALMFARLVRAGFTPTAAAGIAGHLADGRAVNLAGGLQIAATS